MNCEHCNDTGLKMTTPARVASSPSAQFYVLSRQMFVKCECGSPRFEKSIIGMYCAVPYSVALAWAEAHRTASGHFVEAQ